MADSGSGAPVSQVPAGIGGGSLYEFSGLSCRKAEWDGLFLALCEVLRFMQILVRDNNVDQALRALKKKLQREGVYREMKLRRHFEKPSEKRAREKAAAVRRARKLERKRLERDGGK
jgi:small subunit ribosomal protein S21